ncbi:putative Transmembrane protein [Quillaja saponaria]|uniref:Transmembrane protein n=1 Tax=Quillaja saponaria TaxID=32244 RepID=A0AAD7PVK3_QUISA|nr:putative Transmembrane protein [Quillaja saponaria]
MEENEVLLKLIFVFSLGFYKVINLFLGQLTFFLSLIPPDDPLFSSIVTFYTLILLYFPHFFWKIIFSPILILTGILLLCILRLGAIQRLEYGNQKHKENKVLSVSTTIKENRAKESKPSEPELTNSLEEVYQWVTCHSLTGSNSEMGFDPNPCFVDSFVEWDVKAPLEVIHEAYEGEEAEENPNEKEYTQHVGIQKYPSLSLYYPESDSDCSSDDGFPAIGKWESPENICFRWDEEDREGLIEIALDYGNKKKGLEFHVEEENLIEIDISPTRHSEFSGELLR